MVDPLPGGGSDKPLLLRVKSSGAPPGGGPQLCWGNPGRVGDVPAEAGASPGVPGGCVDTRTPAGGSPAAWGNPRAGGMTAMHVGGIPSRGEPGTGNGSLLVGLKWSGLGSGIRKAPRCIDRGAAIPSRDGRGSAPPRLLCCCIRPGMSSGLRALLLTHRRARMVRITVPGPIALAVLVIVLHFVAR